MDFPYRVASCHHSAYLWCICTYRAVPQISWQIPSHQPYWWNELLAFIIFHILDLTLGVAPAAPTAFEHGHIYANMIASFSRWPVAIFYILAMVVLFLHLSHGIYLAVSDLGITGKRTRAVMLALSYLVPAVVMIGNISIPLSIALGLIH